MVQIFTKNLKHIFSSLFPLFSKRRTMPQVTHRVANVTSYGLQGAPITLQTDLSVLGTSCTQPGAKPTTESKDRKIRPLGYFYGRWHTPSGADTSLPAFFPPYSESSRAARGSLEKTDQIQKNEKSQNHQQDFSESHLRLCSDRDWRSQCKNPYSRNAHSQ